MAKRSATLRVLACVRVCEGGWFCLGIHADYSTMPPPLFCNASLCAQVSKYGKVESVRVEVVGAVVKVFVTCESESDVAAAIKNLHRRYFGGRIISARAVPMQ